MTKANKSRAAGKDGAIVLPESRIGYLEPAGPDAYANVQLNLFQRFLANTDQQRDGLSNAIDLWDSVPRYSVSRLAMSKARVNGEFLRKHELTFQHRGKTYTRIVSPARITDEDGQERDYYPSASEELVEDAAAEHVILVMTDGLRWQELFRGADPALLIPENTDKEPVAPLRERYVRATAGESRQALMPFVWTEMVGKGELYGNRDLGSDAHVTNGLNFSYPGYSETLTGHPDPRIHSNDNVQNPNETVLTWLNRQLTPAGGQPVTAVFGAWEVIGGAADSETCGYPVNVGYEPLTVLPASPVMEVLNQMRVEAPRVWADEPFDAPVFRTAMEYMRVRKPRLMFLSLGETDDWAHGGRYDLYLDAAHRTDAYLRTLWEFAQSDPEYRGHTTMLFLTDHGRGGAPEEWKTHGEKIADARFIFLGMMGPGVPVRGELGAAAGMVTQSQVAATIAHLFGKDWRAETPAAGPSIEGVRVP